MGVLRLRKAVALSLKDDINWSMERTPNKGGRPQYRISYDGQTTTRVRRGKIVEIPEEWRGHVTHEQTIRKRDSKQGGKRTKMKKTH